MPKVMDFPRLLRGQLPKATLKADEPETGNAQWADPRTKRTMAWARLAAHHGQLELRARSGERGFCAFSGVRGGRPTSPSRLVGITTPAELDEHEAA